MADGTYIFVVLKLSLSSFPSYGQQSRVCLSTGNGSLCGHYTQLLGRLLLRSMGTVRILPALHPRQGWPFFMHDQSWYFVAVLQP